MFISFSLISVQILLMGVFRGVALFYQILFNRVVASRKEKKEKTK